MANLVFAKYHPIFRRFLLSDPDHIFVQTQEKTKNGMILNDVFDRRDAIFAVSRLNHREPRFSRASTTPLEEDEDSYQYVKRCAVTWKVR